MLNPAQNGRFLRPRCRALCAFMEPMLRRRGLLTPRVQALLVAGLTACLWLTEAHANPAERGQGTVYFDQVRAAARSCVAAHGFEHRLDCYQAASPRGCHAQAENLLADPARRARQNAWYYCVVSCADANFLSRTLGSCRREIVVPPEQSPARYTPADKLSTSAIPPAGPLRRGRQQ